MPVFIITYKQFSGTSVERFQKRVDRYATMEDTIEWAQRFYGSSGKELIKVRLETSGELFMHKAGRLFVRLFRILCGTLLAIVSYILVVKTGPAFGDIPIVQLTLGMIVSGLVRGAVLIGLLAASWALAFGEGPKSTDG